MPSDSKVCGTPRGCQTQVPGPATNSSSPTRKRICPSSRYMASSSPLWTWSGGLYLSSKKCPSRKPRPGWFDGYMGLDVYD